MSSSFRASLLNVQMGECQIEETSDWLQMVKLVHAVPSCQLVSLTGFLNIAGQKFMVHVSRRLHIETSQI